MRQFSVPPSKLPNQEESIFSSMSKLANHHKAVDLSQGFPNFETDESLKELVDKAMKNGFNQYAPMAGVLELREEICKKLFSLYSRKYDPVTEVTLTNGATQALYAAISAFVHKDDEVIVFKPAYDSYEPSIKLNGGVPVLIQLKGENYNIDWQEVEEKISSKTRMIIINTPHNPTGTILQKEDMEQLEKILKDTNIIVLSDEVYEHLVFDGKSHQSAALFPELSSRSIICASFGKTFHNKLENRVLRGSKRINGRDTKSAPV
ncbi:aminotransferase class I/II-fold pyridoxal phosphate-dependent enzyme [Antarcticibacterium sp. 1MA-6-2]|uniref:aminotransferase class I/II-fold pyridoxal phosphate-dependent enzyme n=1 Tax=Antarcticibacterium sp. 1MA-6-2 TaxID=2908210 RepID=UPI0028831E9C|nr:aminotransferase class I/II-fold pyridoxal phosphate-dependent enzyme [Antarcticibacterium sp. 1MA-6-2]